MYLSLGKDTILTESGILGVFDLDNCSQSPVTREFLRKAEERGEVINTAEDIPNSFLLYREGEKTRVFLAQTPSRSMEKRLSD